MKAIHANPKTVKGIFTESYDSSYIIPEFQRPYAWGVEQCDKFFEDITEFFTENTEGGNYYLGSLILYKEKDGDKARAVIDGQQRLTTLSLFLYALFEKAGVIPALEQCLWQVDPLTGIKTDKLRLISEVLPIDSRDTTDREEFESVLAGTEKSGRFKENYVYFQNKLRDFFHGKTSQEINDFILTVLEKIVLLPIECGSMDDALTIFDTVNNRGLPLSDVDIFKAKLFRSARDDNGEEEFRKRWKALTGAGHNDTIENIFRDLMHIKRAQNGDTGNEINIRAFFDKDKEIFKNWRKTLEALEKIFFYYDNGGTSDKAEDMFWVMSNLPFQYWRYPLIVFWFKYAKLQDGEWGLSEETKAEADRLFSDTLRYYYLNAVAYNNVGAVKYTTYLVCKAIWAEENYGLVYADNLGRAKDAQNKFRENIETYRYGRARRGLVALLALLDDRNKTGRWKEDIWGSWECFEIEHIVPQKGGYNNYNCWTEKQYEEKLDTLGNFVALEKPLNIRASNDFFQKKKKHYAKSAYQSARELCELEYWTYAEWEKREKQCEGRLFVFFGINPKVGAEAE